MANPEKFRLAGAWPLGQFTITSGTPIPLATNPTSNLRRPSARQIVINAPSANTGSIYLMLGNNAHTDTDHIIGIVAKGTIQSFPNNAMLHFSEFDLSNIYIDGGTSGDTCQITAFV